MSAFKKIPKKYHPPGFAASAPSYQKLVLDIRREMQRGIARMEELFERQKISSYWAIGRRINSHLSQNEMPRGFISAFYLVTG